MSWATIRAFVYAHRQEVHAGQTCTCPQMKLALQGAADFQRQFGEQTPKGILPDEYDPKTRRWKTVPWWKADSTLINSRDWERVPKHLKSIVLSELGERTDAVYAQIEANPPPPLKRRSPRERKDEITKTLLDVPLIEGKRVYAKSLQDEMDAEKDKGEDDHHAAEKLAQRKLESDARKQNANTGWTG